jgi:hypothetical protein
MRGIKYNMTNILDTLYGSYNFGTKIPNSVNTQLPNLSGMPQVQCSSSSRSSGNS